MIFSAALLIATLAPSESVAHTDDAAPSSRVFRDDGGAVARQEARLELALTRQSVRVDAAARTKLANAITESRAWEELRLDRSEIRGEIVKAATEKVVTHAKILNDLLEVIEHGDAEATIAALVCLGRMRWHLADAFAAVRSPPQVPGDVDLTHRETPGDQALMREPAIRLWRAARELATALRIHTPDVVEARRRLEAAGATIE